MEVLCSLHIEDNTKRDLTEKRVPEKDKNTLCWKIYNKRDGLVASRNELEFRKRALDLGELAYKYMPERWEELQVKLWKYVVVPHIVCPNIPISWKNQGTHIKYHSCSRTK